LFRVKPDRAPAHVVHFFHHVARATRAVTALPIPEAEKVEPLRAEARSRLQHPAVVAFVWILPCWRRTQFDWLAMKRSGRFRSEEAAVQAEPGKVKGLLKEGRIVEGDIKLKPRRTGKRGFREKKIAAACAAANAKVASFDGKLIQRRRDCVRRD